MTMMQNQYTSWTQALDAVLSLGKGEDPTEKIKFPINSKDPVYTVAEHTVQEIKDRALEELMNSRLSQEEVRSLRQFYNPNAPHGLSGVVKGIVDKLQKTAVVQ